MVLQVAFWVKGRESCGLQSRLKNFAICGLLYAAAVYCRPSWLYFVPFALVLDVFAENRLKTHFKSAEYRQKCVEYGTILLIFVLAMSPWWMRNEQITGRFVATSLQMGPSLYDGLNPNADGSSQMDFVDRFREEERTDPSGDPRETYEWRVDQRMKREAVQWARQNPGRVIELAGIKFVRFWNFWPNEPSFSSFPVRLLIFVTYAPLLIGAIGGIWWTWRRGFVFWLCWIPAVYFTALHLIFVSSLRYRVPPMLLLVILAGLFFFRKHDRKQNENRS